MHRRLAMTLALALLVLAGAGAALWRWTPWPEVLIVRHTFETASEAAQPTLDRHAPRDVTTIENLRYAGAADAKLDIYFPTRVAATDKALPTVLWVHGGAWIAGDNDYIESYMKNLASSGYTAVALSYSLAPGAKHPTPVRQTFEALAYLTAEARALHVDPTRFVLAGDSAGAQIAAEAAAVATSVDYAREVGVTPTISPGQLKGALLFCGVYDLGAVDFGGPLGDLMRTAMWSYSGTKDFATDPAFAPFSVARYVTSRFPPTFISAGDADPLLSQSKNFAQVLKSKRVAVDDLFFADGHTPPLPHDYQFALDLPGARQALDRVTKFLARVTKPAPAREASR